MNMLKNATLNIVSVEPKVKVGCSHQENHPTLDQGRVSETVTPPLFTER
jgi:hypothetical protein